MDTGRRGDHDLAASRDHERPDDHERLSARTAVSGRVDAGWDTGPDRPSSLDTLAHPAGHAERTPEWTPPFERTGEPDARVDTCMDTLDGSRPRRLLPAGACSKGG